MTIKENSLVAKAHGYVYSPNWSLKFRPPKTLVLERERALTGSKHVIIAKADDLSPRPPTTR